MMGQDIQGAAPAERVAVTGPVAGVRKSVSLKSAALTRNKVMAGEDRQRLIAEAAYFRAEQRGFTPGRELEDWLAAEIEIDALLGEDEP